MTVRTPPSSLQAGSHSAENDRYMASALVYAGVVSAFGLPVADPTKDLGVAQHSTPGMSVDVARGAAFVLGTQGSGLGGIYHVYNDALLQVNLTPADPTNARIDVIGVRVQNAEYGGSTNTASLFVKAGTPSGSPAVPTLPDNFLPLAHIAVAANAPSITNANITDVRTVGAGLYSTPNIDSLAHLPAIPITGSGIYLGSADELEGPLYPNTNGDWTPPWNMAWGEQGRYEEMTANSATFTGTATDISTLNTITFDAVPNRIYVAEVHAPALRSTATGDTVMLEITDDPFAVVHQQTPVDITAANHNQLCIVRHRFVGLTGTIALKVRGLRTNGSGTCSLVMSSTVTTSFRITDEGPSGPPA